MARGAATGSMDDVTSAPARPAGSSFHTALAVWIVFGGASILAIAAVAAFGPGVGTVCVIRSFSGVPCPACGMTRAMAAMLDGDFSRAFSIHPLGPPVAFESIVAWCAWGASLALRRRGLDEAKLLNLMWANLAALVVVWVVRLWAGTLPV